MINKMGDKGEDSDDEDVFYEARSSPEPDEEHGNGIASTIPSISWDLETDTFEQSLMSPFPPFDREKLIKSLNILTVRMNSC